MFLQSLEMYTPRMNVSSFFFSSPRTADYTQEVLLQRVFLAFWALEACKLQFKKFWMLLGIIGRHVQWEEHVRDMWIRPACAGTPDHKNCHVKANTRRAIDLLLEVRPAHLKCNETVQPWSKLIHSGATRVCVRIYLLFAHVAISQFQDKLARENLG